MDITVMREALRLLEEFAPVPGTIDGRGRLREAIAKHPLADQADDPLPPIPYARSQIPAMVAKYRPAVDERPRNIRDLA